MGTAEATYDVVLLQLLLSPTLYGMRHLLNQRSVTWSNDDNEAEVATVQCATRLSIVTSRAQLSFTTIHGDRGAPLRRIRFVLYL